MGGALPAEGGSGDVADVANTPSAPGGCRVSLAFSARRARLASRARLSSSPRRSASITAVPAGPDGVTGHCSGGVTLPGRHVAVRDGPEPRRPRTTVQPSPGSDLLASPGLVGEVWVSAVASTADGCGVRYAAGPDGTPGPVRVRPKDRSRDIN